MKWIIASDIHGSAPCCEKLIDAFYREKGERLILLGDLLYHGPRNTPPGGYDTKTVEEMLNEFVKHTEIAAVRGNCDAEVDQFVLDFSIMDDYHIHWDGKRYFFATHGHIYNEHEHPYFTPGTVLLHGHTHVPACEKYKDFLYINPGSVSLPRGGSERSYMTYDGNVFRWKYLEDGACFKEYKID